MEYDNPEIESITCSEDLSFLMLQNASESDLGRYECIVKTLDGKNLTHVNHLLGTSPTVEKEKQDDLVVLKGASIRLTCDISGNPLPNNTWYKVKELAPRFVLFLQYNKNRLYVVIHFHNFLSFI